MRILLIEAYYQGSHKQWADDLVIHSRHEIDILTLPGRHWKWRMHGGAISLAEKYVALEKKYDLILTTDMMDLALFKACIGETLPPIAIYFHENQLTYPFSKSDTDVLQKRDNHYGFINYTSALVADRVIFNSNYHKNIFCEELGVFLERFPDFQNTATVDRIYQKSVVIPLGFDFNELDQHRIETLSGLILWNHRWSYDKNPEAFFTTLFKLKENSITFRLAVLGQATNPSPPIFKKAKEILHEEIIHFGFCQSRQEYIQWLWKSDIIPVTSIQDFFGISAVEAMYCNTKPLLPDRLAFREHLDDSHLSDCLYSDDDELFFKLKSMLNSMDDGDHQSIRDYLGKYDWKQCEPLYHKAFENLILA